MREFNFIVFFYNQQLKSSQMYFPTDHFYKEKFSKAIIVFFNLSCNFCAQARKLEMIHSQTRWEPKDNYKLPMKNGIHPHNVCLARQAWQREKNNTQFFAVLSN